MNNIHNKEIKTMGITELDLKYKQFEKEYSFSITKQLPIILRLDGKGFSKLTKHIKNESPFNLNFIQTMNETALYLTSNIQSCVFGYVQSDEISLLLNPFVNADSQGWFDNKLQKIVSITASWAGAVFSTNSAKIFGTNQIVAFDCRVMTPSREEVIEIFNWRQKDGIRNSAQMLARSLYSHTQCENKSIKELKQMCFDKGQDWNQLSTGIKQGRMLTKKPFEKSIIHPKTGELIKFTRHEWVLEDSANFSKNQKIINDLVLEKLNE